MSLSQHQEQLLERTEHALNRSAPDLAAMLAAFGAANHGEPMPAHERQPSRAAARTRAAAWLALLAGWLAPVCDELIMTAGTAWGACYCLDDGSTGYDWADPRQDG